jgi:cytochrome c oxidase subunit 2
VDTDAALQVEPLFQVARASQWAGRVDALFLTLLALSLAVGVALATLVIVYVVRYRRGHPAVRRAHYEHEERLEVLWTALPMLLFLGLFVWGAKIYLDMSHPPADALDIYAVGKQWMWKFQHPSGRAEINTLHLPLGRPVRVVLASEDVIHSFYVPAFRVKKDAVPGLYTDVWFTPTRVGRYRLMCAEYCGADHARMQGFAVVESESDYAAWAAHGAGERTGLAAEGEALFASLGCGGCHGTRVPSAAAVSDGGSAAIPVAQAGPAATDDGSAAAAAGQASTVRAPSLAGIYGRRIPTSAGLVAADESYLRDSILVPDRIVTAGYDPVMPAYGTQLDDADVTKLIAYLKTLTAEDSR